VKYAEVYPGVDLIYYGNNGGQLEYDFVVAPGANPNVVTLDVLADCVGAAAGERHSTLQIGADGDLVIENERGEIHFQKPVVYQEQTTVDSSQLAVRHDVRDSRFQTRSASRITRHSLEGRYVLKGENGIGFEVASYDHSRPLIIDPVLIYSSYLGGSADDRATGIAVDSAGNAYHCCPN
jgi:hypothetical protein